MSSTNDTYHQLFIQSQPKSILKKSPSPRYINSENDYDYNSILSLNHDIDNNKINNNHVCILNNNQSITKDTSIEVPLMISNVNSEIDNDIDSSSVTSDDE